MAQTTSFPNNVQVPVDEEPLTTRNVVLYSNQKTSPPQIVEVGEQRPEAEAKPPQKARRPLSSKKQILLDSAMAICSIYFLVFAILVYTHRGQPATLAFNASLLEASRYASTLAPSLACDLTCLS
jgi:hypothetical protein